jgi:hypothetical protein
MVDHLETDRKKSNKKDLIRKYFPNISRNFGFTSTYKDRT